MEVLQGPDSVDEPSLLYKLQRKIKVFNTSDTLPNRGYNLVTSSSKYGLVFIAVPDGMLSVYQLNQLVDRECEPQHLTVKLQEKPTHVSVSCDYELLAVTGGQLLSVYKVASFQNPNVSPSFSIRTEVGPSTFVSALQWNPCIPDSIVIAYYNGTLMSCLVNSGQVYKVASGARCICWSPKGKQLVTGNSDGTLIQYKPELTAAKRIPAPNLFEGHPAEVLAIYWISTFQFAAVYRNAADNSRPSVTIVNTPKAGQPTCVTYGDICYSMGTNRPWYYYLQGLPQWNIIMASSSNSMEIGTFGGADGGNWVQWCQSDEARPELPLTDKKIENYPVGLCIDTCAIHQLPWGENDSLPPMPLLHVVSQHGLLAVFNIINLNNTAAQVCTPPQMLTLPAQALTSAIPGATPAPAAPPSVPNTAAAAQAATSAIQHALQTATAAPPPLAAAVSATISIPSFTPQTNLSFGTPASSTSQVQVQEQRPAEGTPPAPAAASQPPAAVAQPKVQPQKTAADIQQEAEEAAARKAQQEKERKEKANQELKEMLVKEFNDFQMELYNFKKKTRESQAWFERDLEAINAKFKGVSLDTEELKKECSMDELRAAIVQLKLDLVRACAVVAEARTHADARDLHEWSQADPLTTKSVSSVKKLSYYIQTQLAQAHAALDHTWNEWDSRDKRNNVPGTRMIRPVLDDVYQPLVKQQEILVRQQAVLRTLKGALAECDVGPVFKSTSLLRSTPFRNNKDPLSKLTKNILNMSLEAETKPKKPLLSAQKLDALRDVLSNHKTAKIKPVKIDLRKHMETIRENYERSLREAEKAQAMMKPPAAKMVKVVQKEEPVTHSPPPKLKPASKKPASKQPAAVAKVLFTDEPSKEIPRPVSKPFEQPTTSAAAVPVTNAKSVLKDILTNKQTNLDSKNISNAFMGQKICSPSAFAQPSAPTPSSALNANKFQPQPFVAESKSTLNARQDMPGPSGSNTRPSSSNIGSSGSNIQSNETGELEGTKPSKPNMPMTNLFGMKTPLASSTPLPGPSKVSQAIAPLAGPSKTTQSSAAPLPGPSKTSQSSTPLPGPSSDTRVTAKPLEKLATKENVPERASENVPNALQKAVEKKEAPRPLTSAANKNVMPGASTSKDTAATGASTSSGPKPLNLKTEVKTAAPKESQKTNTAASSATSIFGTANASISAPRTVSGFATSSGSVSSEPVTPANSAPSASSIFGATVASQPKTTGSIFASTSSVFNTAATTASVFGGTSTPTLGPATSSAKGAAASVFRSASNSQASSTTVTDATTTVASIFASGAISITPVFGSASGSSSVGKATANTAASVFGSASSDVAPTTSTTSGPSVTTKPAAASVFGSAASVFGSTSPSVASPATSASIFGTNVSSVASPTTSAPALGSISPSAASPTTSAFGSTSSAASPTTTASIFGSAAPSVPSSVFATTTASTALVFGSPSQTSVFAPKEATPSAFTPTTSSVFGTVTSQASSVFAQATQSVFGGTTQASIFGATTQASVFASPTTQTSVFGSPTATTQASVFGAPTQTTQASIFGTPTAVTPASVFGTPAQATPSVFGTPSPTTQASVFGSPTQTTQASVFGSPTQTTQASVFGSPTQTTQASVFGSPTQTTQASVFGSPTQTTQGSLFGQPATTQSASLFGGGESNLFAAASISPSSAPAAASGGNIFGSSTGSVFGGGASTNVFGSKTTFGQPNPATASIFGGGASFGQKPATNLWGSGNTTSGGFGSSAFGQAATTQASSIFGGTTGGSFSQPSGGAFSAPPQPSAFGSPTQQQQGPAFGGGAVFGSKPLFGQPSGFGSPTSSGFGSPAAFGGFNKSPGGSAFGAPAFGGGSAFGASSPGGGFASATQSNATFESLATQNTLTFGNLAQQSGVAQQPAAPAFNTSSSFSGWRG